MFTHYRTKGIILKKVDRKEADQLFTIYTKDFGKINVLGRGIRKTASKLRSGMENIYFSEIEFIQGKNYKTLTDAILIDKFKSIRNNLEKLTVVNGILEVFDNLINLEQQDNKIWQLLFENLKFLNDNNIKLENLSLSYHYFFWNFLSILGYKPELYHCPACHQKLRPEKLYFNQGEGGVICNNCFLKKKSGKEIELDTIKTLRLILDKNNKIIYRLKIGDNTLNLLADISKDYLSFFLERDIKSDILKV